MTNPACRLAFILASTDHGTTIVNRFDRHDRDHGGSYGVGHQLLEKTVYEPNEVGLRRALLGYRRRYSGDGVVAIDCGANAGVHTIESAKAMTGWGIVIGYCNRGPGADFLCARRQSRDQ